MTGVVPRIIVVAPQEIFNVLANSGVPWDPQYAIPSVTQMWEDLSNGRIDQASRALIFTSDSGSIQDISAAVAVMAPHAPVAIIARHEAEADQFRGSIARAQVEHQQANAPFTISVNPLSGHELLHQLKGPWRQVAPWPNDFPASANLPIATPEEPQTWAPAPPAPQPMPEPIPAPSNPFAGNQNPFTHEDTAPLPAAASEYIEQPQPAFQQAPTPPIVPPAAPQPPVMTEIHHTSPAPPPPPATGPGPTHTPMPAPAHPQVDPAFGAPQPPAPPAPAFSAPPPPAAPAPAAAPIYTQPVAPSPAPMPGSPNVDDLLSQPPLPGQLTLTVTSAKGGSGKTTVAACIAATIAQSSAKAGQPKRVVLVDMDTRDSQVGSIIGKWMPTALNIRVQPRWDKDAILSHLVRSDELGIDVLLAPVRPKSADNVGPDFYRHIIRSLQRTHDVVVMDTSVNYLDPLISTVCLPEASAVLIVTTLAATSVHGMARALREILEPTEKGGMGIPRQRVGIVVNQAVAGVGMDIDQVITAALKVPVVGAVPLATTDVLAATNSGRLHTLLTHPRLGPAYFGLAQACLPNSALAPLVDIAGSGRSPMGGDPADDARKRGGLFRKTG